MVYVYSKALFLWLFEAICQKGLFYFLNIANPAFFELLAYTGYKFVVMCPIVTAEMFVGYMGSYCVMVLFGSLFAYFFFMTLMRFSRANTLAAHVKEVSLNRKTFMLANCAV